MVKLKFCSDSSNKLILHFPPSMVYCTCILLISDSLPIPLTKNFDHLFHFT